MDLWERIKSYDNYTLILAGILLFAFIVRLYFYLQYNTQGLWYDEADYVVRSNALAFQELAGLDYSDKKPVFMPFIWSLFLKLGLGEMFIKFFQVILSTLGVYGIYLLAKEAYNKKVGLIAAALVTVFYLHIFFSFRVMLDTPAFLFTVFAAYFFIKWYKRKKTRDIIIAAVFTSIALQTFYIPLWLLVLFFVFLLITRRQKLFTDKDTWYALGTFILVTTPWLLWSWITLGDPFFGFKVYTSSTATIQQGGDYIVGQFLQVIPQALFTVLFVIFAIAIGKVILEVLLNFKDIIQRKTKEYDMELFFLLWIIIFPALLATQISHVEPRYMLPAFVVAFVFMASLVVTVMNLIQKQPSIKYAKIIAVLVAVAFIVYGGYVQLGYASTLIEEKSHSFDKEREAGEWLQNNLGRDEQFITCNQQAIFEAYSGRKGHTFATNTSRAEMLIEEYQPKYLMIDGYFGDCAYDYPKETPELYKPVNVLFHDDNQQQPIILIYEVIYLEEQTELLE